MAKFVQHLDAVNRVGTIGWQVVNPGHLGLNSSFPVPLSRLTCLQGRRRSGAEGGGGAGEGRRATSSVHDSMLEISCCWIQ